MPRSYKDRLQCTVSGTPGTGTITVSTASSGYRAFEAGDAGKTFSCVFTDGADIEVATDCLYTHSGTTLTRGTFVWSTTGSALSLTSAAIVSHDPSAADGTRWEGKASEADIGAHLLNSNGAPTTADVTGVVGTMHVLDLSGLTADRNFTLPTTAAVGSRIGLMVSVGHASHNLIIKPATGDTINGGSAGAEWSRLFITGETVILRCITADSAWIVENDGRIPCRFYARLTTQADGEAAATLITPTACSTPGAWTTDLNVGSAWDGSSGVFTARRANGWNFGCNYRPKDAITALKYASVQLAGPGNQQVFAQSIAPTGTTLMYIVGSGYMNLAAADTMTYKFRTEEGGLGASTSCYMAGSEVLQ